VIEIAGGGDAAVVEAVAGAADLPERSGVLLRGDAAGPDDRRRGERRDASC
jgi:hypothetical protein